MLADTPTVHTHCCHSDRKRPLEKSMGVTHNAQHDIAPLRPQLSKKAADPTHRMQATRQLQPHRRHHIHNVKVQTWQVRCLKRFALQFGETLTFRIPPSTELCVANGSERTSLVLVVIQTDLQMELVTCACIIEGVGAQRLHYECFRGVSCTCPAHTTWHAWAAIVLTMCRR